MANMKIHNDLIEHATIKAIEAVATVTQLAESREEEALLLSGITCSFLLSSVTRMALLMEEATGEKVDQVGLLSTIFSRVLQEIDPKRLTDIKKTARDLKRRATGK